jgi:hypothetical protein
MLLLFDQYFLYSSHPAGGIASPAFRLFAENTRRVFLTLTPAIRASASLQSAVCSQQSAIIQTGWVRK